MGGGDFSWPRVGALVATDSLTGSLAWRRVGHCHDHICFIDSWS